MQNYDLIVVSPEPFPYGQAATNRMLSYLVGIASSKHVLYICLAAPSSAPSPNISSEGIYKNIHYRYLTSPNNAYQKSKFIRACNLMLRYITLVKDLIFQYRCRSLLIYSADKIIIKSLLRISKIKGIRIFRDITELVGYNYQKNSAALSAMKTEMSKFTGLIVISEGIYDYFDNLDSDRKILIPVLVDPDRFQVVEQKEKNIFVCSGANLERDGLLDSLNGFLLFNKQNPDFKFEIASSLNLRDSYHLRCKKLIDENLESIHWLGPLPSYEIPDKIARASVLLLTPHANYKTKGFPTKLGEYLMSATPVICSTIDDLDDVVRHCVVYPVEPNSPNAIAEMLQYVISHPAEAVEKGTKARQYMLDHYTIKSYESKLIEFLEI